jgi:hypothetical protein
MGEVPPGSARPRVSQRDFDSRMAGVALKLLARPLPTSTDLRVKSIPEWRGNRPFGF